MTPEAARYLDKARQCLADAVLYQPLVPRIAGREAYLAAFHAAEALIYERTGKITKTHRGLRAQFGRITRGDSRVDRALSEFLGQAYELKSLADYGTGERRPFRSPPLRRPSKPPGASWTTCPACLMRASLPTAAAQDTTVTLPRPTRLNTS